MEPKEKAKELVDVMRDEIPCHCDDWEQAKQCALIAVQELINQCWDYREIDLGMSLEYWEEVKQEIEKL